MTIIRKHRPLGFPALMDDFFNNEFFHIPAKGKSVPAVNIKETENGFELEMAAPGLKKDEFGLELKENTLTISSKHEQKNESNDEQGNYTRKEFSYSSFSRSFNLPEDIDQGNISASHADGILKIEIPRKAVEAKVAKQIAIA